MCENKKYFIRINGQLVPVTKDVYSAYYGMSRHEKYLREKDARHRLVHYAAWNTSQNNGEEEIADLDSESVEDTAVRCVTAEKLKAYIGLLNKNEQALIIALFFSNNGKGMTEREY